MMCLGAEICKTELRTQLADVNQNNHNIFVPLEMRYYFKRANKNRVYIVTPSGGVLLGIRD